ncbi:MAG: HYC_CC_PP family protein [Flavobacteriaceae bacterium]|nr:hypothetical protein [Psychroflexus sp.]
MKEIFSKVSSVLMAFVVMTTTMSFAVDMHYCGDALVDFSLFHTAETCGMEDHESQMSCEKEMSEKSCCSDTQIELDTLDGLNASYTHLTFEQQIFVTTFFDTHFNLFEGLDKNIIPFRDYISPYLIRDVQKLHETYLI